MYSSIIQTNFHFFRFVFHGLKKAMLCLLLFTCNFIYGQNKNAPNKLIRPGKIDLLTTVTSEVVQVNSILWGPAIKAGFGVISRKDSNQTIYGGFFFRPTHLLKTKNELILGTGFIQTKGKTDFEIQSEFRHHSGLAIGAGYINSNFFEAKNRGVRSDDYFLKLSYRTKSAKWNHIESLLLQEFGDKKFIGGYVAAYNKIIGFSAGHEGESWRVSANFNQKENKDKFLRPAFEALYINKKTGFNKTAPRILWLNGTLKFSGGFLSKDGWLGRSMGAAGLEFGNPLGYLIPLNDGSAFFPGPPGIWNRALNTWEIGGLLNARLFHLDLPNKSKWGKADLIVFPGQFFKKRTVGDYFFAGLTYFYNTNLPNNAKSIQNPILLGGFIKRAKKWNIAIEGEYDTKFEKGTFNLGIIRIL